jgi:hypothetical protein
VDRGDLPLPVMLDERMLAVLDCASDTDIWRTNASLSPLPQRANGLTAAAVSSSDIKSSSTSDMLDPSG